MEDEEEEAPECGEHKTEEVPPQPNVGSEIRGLHDEKMH